MSEDLEALLESLAQEDSTEAPAQPTTSVLSKLVFQRARAKNFRSIGNEWMEFDFNTHLSTLVVSDDNGSGKSTLCVWVPYFALFGKPYNKKEKIGALVNTATGKDLEVELYFSVRGFSYKIHRGYKPALFDIYKMVGGEWVRHETKAGQQQDDLDKIINIDASILEKTMILGLDKYVPFVDLDTPQRRDMVERVWDLGVFSVMLEDTKRQRATVRRDLEQTHNEITLKEQERDQANEALGNVKGFKETLADNVSELETLQQTLTGKEAKIPELEAQLQSVKDSAAEGITEAEARLQDIKLEVAAEFKAEGEKLRADLEEAKKEGERLEDEAANEFVSILTDRKGELQKVTETTQAESTELNKTIAARVAELQANMADVTVEAEKQRDAILAETFDRTAGPEYLQGVEAGDKKEKLQEIQVSIQYNIDEANKRKRDAELRLKGHVTELNVAQNQRNIVESKLEEFQQAEKKLAETGTCSHCLQEIGETAIALYRESVASEKTKWNNALTELAEKETAVEELIAAVEGELKKIDNDLALLEKELSTSEEKIRELTDIESELLRIVDSRQLKFETERDSRAANIFDKVRAEAKAASTEYVHEAKALQAELKSKHDELLNSAKLAVDTVQAELEAKVAQAQTKATELASEAQAAFNTWQQRAGAAIAERTAGVKAEIDTLKKTSQHEQDTITDGITSLQREIRVAVSAIEEKERTNESLRSRIETMEQTNQSKFDDAITHLEELGALYQATTRRGEHLDYLISELGDNAAKREIIARYIPFLNSKINEYMAAMGLSVGFKMDEAFKIEFQSPDRKNQTIYSLSNGQRTRMNISILFALRDIANLKNTTATNLLVLDEILDPVSEQGIREAVEMLRNKFSDTNIVVISQRKQEFMEYFDHTITYGLKGGFTTILEED